MKEICKTCRNNPSTCIYYPRGSNVLLVACDKYKSKIKGSEKK